MDTAVDTAALDQLARRATIHCLTGCGIGEVLGMVIGSAMSLSNSVTIAISVVLAFLFGYTLTMMPLLRGGLAFRPAMKLAFAADTLTIAVMEILDNMVPKRGLEPPRDSSPPPG